MRLLFRITLVSVLIICAPRSLRSQAPAISSEAKQHLVEIVEALRNNWLHRDTMDWALYESRVLEKAAGAATIPETYPAIRYALALLGERHSHYVAKDGRRLFAMTLPGDTLKPCSPAPFYALAPAPNVGYIRVRISPPMPAAEIDSIIRSQAETARAGWIVDLRRSGGGNMWPALAGLGSLLGDGIAGYFIDARGDAIPWGYTRGRAWLGMDTLSSINEPFRLAKLPRVAVITDAGVSSSGEAIAIAFRGRPNSRSFGTATCGLSTANRGTRLTNGATMIIAGRYMADRSKNTYDGPVYPDEPIGQPELLRASILSWLLGK